MDDGPEFAGAHTGHGPGDGERPSRAVPVAEVEAVCRLEQVAKLRSIDFP